MCESCDCETSIAIINKLNKEIVRLRKQKEKYHRLYLESYGNFCDFCGKFLPLNTEKVMTEDDYVMCMKCFKDEENSNG